MATKLCGSHRVVVCTKGTGHVRPTHTGAPLGERVLRSVAGQPQTRAGMAVARHGESDAASAQDTPAGCAAGVMAEWGREVAKVHDMTNDRFEVTTNESSGAPVHATAICMSAQHAWRESGLDKLRDMCYHSVSGGPGRREQVSLVRFAHSYGLHEEVVPIENADDSVLKPRDARMPIEGK